MASEYKKRGGGYNTDKKDQDESQKHLSQWTEEEWQTKEGSGNAKQADGTEKRYLPKKALEDMNEEERMETDEKKLKESKEGKQFVQNTERAKSARQKANKGRDEEIEEGNGKEKKDMASEPQDAKETNEQTEEEAQGDAKAGNTANTGQKRSRGRPKNDPNSEERPSKKKKAAPKSKSARSKKHGTAAPAAPASAERLPEEGQAVHWKSLPGWIEGTVVEVAYEDKEVEGKSVKAKEDDPRIVMRSKSGKIAVHKPSAVFFD